MVQVSLDKEDDYYNDYNGIRYTFKTWLYDVAIFLFDIVFTIFFREITVRGSYYVPIKNTPTILVCAPHANQFIDPLMVMSQTRKISGSSSRQVCMVAAEAPMKKNKYVKFFGKWTGAIPVARIQDNLQPVDSRIKLYVPDFDEDPCLVKFVMEEPFNNKETIRKFTERSLIGLPNYMGSAQIEKIIDDRTLKLRKPFPNTASAKRLCSQPTEFMYAEKIDNSIVYQTVFDHLRTGGCVGIFPEGGSHDRPSLLPLKAGVAIMALSAVAADPSLEVNIVPCGLHYFHRDKFRSRATLEFIEPIKVTGEMGEKYKSNPKETASSLLKTIQDSLFSVTINADDFETLEIIQAARRLYDPVPIGSNGQPEKMPLSTVVEMTRRLLAGYSKFKDEPRIRRLKDAVKRYNKMLYAIGLKDHQVMQLKPSNNFFTIFFRLLIRLTQALVMVLAAVPGTILFSPIFAACKYFAKKKANEGLKKSVVKIKGNDLIATWKILIALTMAPAMYTSYSLIIVFVIMKYSTLRSFIFIPPFILKSSSLCFVYSYTFLVSITYISFKTGEKGMDILKSIPPLFISLIYPTRTWKRFYTTREQLKTELTEVCRDYGPNIFPEMLKTNDSKWIDHEGFHPYDVHTSTEFLDNKSIFEGQRSRSSSINSLTSSVSNALSKINSRGSFSDIPIFSDNADFSSHVSESEFVNVDQSVQSKISSLIYEERGRDRAG